RERIGRIHDEIRRLRNPRLADQRLGEALRMMRVVGAEAAFDAKPLMIRGTVATYDADDPIVGDVIGELAAHPAVRTHRSHVTVDRLEIRVVRGRKRSRRARLHAFATGDTG